MSNKKNGKDYFARMRRATAYTANIDFMDAAANMAFAFRLRFAWDIIKGVNPVTGKLVSRGGVRDNLMDIRNGR